MEKIRMVGQLTGPLGPGAALMRDATSVLYILSVSDSRNTVYMSYNHSWRKKDIWARIWKLLAF